MIDNENVRTDNPSTTGRIVKYSEEWWGTRTPEVRARRCHKGEGTGEQCRKVAMEGQRVCGTHGGRAPQAKAAARRRLDEAADRMAKQLLGIAESAESESVKLAAVRDALDRAGLKAPTQVEIGPKEPAPWERLMGDVAHVTFEQHQAMKGGQPRPALAPPAELEIVDAEVVDEAAPYPPSSTPGHPAAADRTDVHPTRPAWAEEPPSAPANGLMTLEEANAQLREAERRHAEVARARRQRD